MHSLRPTDNAASSTGSRKGTEPATIVMTGAFAVLARHCGSAEFPFAAICKLGRPCSVILALEFLRPAAFLVAHQNPSRLVPVGQHPALADPAVDAVLVPGRAVGVAVDQPRIAV